jgi:hypothetical protein
MWKLGLKKKKYVNIKGGLFGGGAAGGGEN